MYKSMKKMFKITQSTRDGYSNGNENKTSHPFNNLWRNRWPLRKTCFEALQIRRWPRLKNPRLRLKEEGTKAQSQWCKGKLRTHPASPPSSLHTAVRNKRAARRV